LIHYRYEAKKKKKQSIFKSPTNLRKNLKTSVAKRGLEGAKRLMAPCESGAKVSTPTQGILRVS
jgi:hypothetical protein